MTTMLDKCAVAGDITQGIDRRGVWTAAITVIGGTSNTAVKLVSCDTVDGEYTDFKTLISAADAETDQYKGFVVDLHGAKKYIKVTGAVMATAVFGDCDHDVKAIAITEGEVPSGADLEDNKEVEITENGEIEITPSAGKDGMKKVSATVNVPSDAKEEQTKSVTITENGTTTVSPDSGKVLSSVSITANVETPKADKYFLWGNDSSRSADNHPNDWRFLYSSSSFSHYSSVKPSYYIKGKDSLADFTQGETVRLYNPGHPTDYVDATVGTKESGTVAITYTVDTHQVTGYISRTKSTIVTALTTFARFDGVTTISKFEYSEITINGSYLPANDSDGIANVFVNVPAQTVTPTLVSSTEQITPVLNTAITYQVSDGSGGYLALCRVNSNGTMTSKGSSSDVTFLAIDDIISGTANEMRIHASGPGTDSFKLTCSVTGSGSGYPYTFTITPTQIGADFTNKIVIVRIK